jgi:hypothetical protein
MSLEGMGSMGPLYPENANNFCLAGKKIDA